VVARKVAADIFTRHSNLYYNLQPDDPKDNFVNLITSDDQFHKDWTQSGPGSVTLLPQSDGTFVLETVGPNTTGANSPFRTGYPTTSAFLQTQVQYGDMELRLEWKAFRVPAGSPQAISGVLLNSARATHANAVLIPINQAAISWHDDYENFPPDYKTTYGDSLFKTGAIYGIAPATRWMAKVDAPENFDGYWNEFRITLQDGKVTVVLNNVQVSQATLPSSISSSGFLGFEIRTGKVQFRNIRMKDLQKSHA